GVRHRSQIHAGVADRLQRCTRTRGILPPFVITRGRVMRKFLLATAALIAFAGPAIAVDMRAPAYKAPPPVVPAWSWTGCFVGGHAGSLWTKQDWTNLTPGGDFFGAWLRRHQANYLLGTRHAGLGDAYRPVL